LTLCNAGAEPPMIFRNGDVIKPKAEGVPIGLLDSREYEEVEFQTERGDLILFYSDGVEDQLNAAGEDFSRLRITRLLKKLGAEPPKVLANAIFSELDAYRDDTPITDDQSVVVMRVC
jgi:sigma-B regulation protein RsbU (phosphoserine phosphatase)